MNCRVIGMLLFDNFFFFFIYISFEGFLFFLLGSNILILVMVSSSRITYNTFITVIMDSSILLDCLCRNSCNYNSNFIGVLSNSRDLRQNNDIVVHPSLNTSMLQDLGFQWATSAENYSNHPTNDLQLAKIKQELSDSFPKYGDHSTLEDLHSPSTSYVKQEQQYLQDLNEKFLLRNFSSGCQVNGFHTSSGDFYTNHQSSTGFGTLTAASLRGNYSRILPTANISSVTPPSSSFPSSLGMNLQALDLLASTKAGVNFSQPLLNNLGSFKGSPFGLDHLQESSQGPSNIREKVRMTFFLLLQFLLLLLSTVALDKIQDILSLI